MVEVAGAAVMPGNRCTYLGMVPAAARPTKARMEIFIVTVLIISYQRRRTKSCER